MAERPLTLTVEEAGRMLGVSRGVAYEAVRRGQVPSIRVGRRILVPRLRLEQMLGLENGERPAATPGAREDRLDRSRHGPA
jgi:excisionase family DNA binding protein